MKKTCTLLLAILLSVSSRALAQIVFTDIVPDTTISTWDNYSFGLHPSSSGSVYIWFHPFSPNDVMINAIGNYEVLMDASGTYPAMLSAGDDIDPSGIWEQPAYYILNKGGSQGNWMAGGIDKYLGLRCKMGTHWHYGWVKMTVDNTPSLFTVMEKAYNAVADEAVKAGQKSSTNIPSTPAEQAFNIAMEQKQVSIKCPYAPKGYHVSVYDISGRTILQMDRVQDPVMDFSAYPGGTYYIRIGTTNSWNTFKVSLP